ncbi:hypothetical protein J3U22_08025 [Gilliamella sp. B2865]|uniref:hypothetical protein n=1 Tax=unclassified Gilliamella TaxID=2685620 RepID=UPI00226A5B4A|nr:MULTISPECIES: hypothetical protein [unclassified Gilliamella]MCX8670967.1 hypothetical protein [Gilliamella sp. B2785]MCX8679559.1 hypothetical protein [Gilliamella sp. B2865]
MVFFLPFSGHALTSQATANQIQGTPPYLTFDGGRTRAVDANGLLGITLSDGAHYTPSTNSSSSSRPIVLPVAGQSFADISMFVPTDTNSVDLSALIGPPNNYWGDDDGDSGVTATGSLSLSIVDRNNRPVSRNTVLTTCNGSAPYRIKLSSTNGTLSTRYGFPNRSTFRESNVTYYVNPKSGTSVCVRFARPNLMFGKRGDWPSYPSFDFAGPSWMWDPNKGFLTQETNPSLYGRNFPATGANGLYFDLLITGSSQPLSWSPVSRSGITATMSNSTATSVRVTLTGPYATESQINSRNPGPISKPTLPQTFELVGRDSNGAPVVKYGFTLKWWFVNRGSYRTSNYSDALSWCNSLGYKMPRIWELTNSNYRRLGAPPFSPDNYYQRRIDTGFFTEWGRMVDYSGVGFTDGLYWTSDPYGSSQYVVNADYGSLYAPRDYQYGLCTHP